MKNFLIYFVLNNFDYDYILNFNYIVYNLLLTKIYKNEHFKTLKIF